MIWLESIAAVISALAVWLTAQRKPSSWPIALVSVVLYGWVFIDAKLYSDTLLQGIFGIMIVYGWVRWVKHLDTEGKVRVAPLAPGPILIHCALGVVGALVLGYLMHRFTDAALPWLDSALTSFSLVGQWWQARRHLAAWWLWITVDVIYVGEYIYKGLNITAVLYAGFVLLAVMGLKTWQAAARAENPETWPQETLAAKKGLRED